MTLRDKYQLTTDCVVFGYTGDALEVALIERKQKPFKGEWALPGGFLEGNETVEECAYRELQEETNIDDLYLEQFHVFSEPDRDPRGRVITTAFFALVNEEGIQLSASEDAKSVQWWPAYNLPPLAFDHHKIYQMALKKMRLSVEENLIAFKLLPKEFTLTQLQSLYEAIYNESYDKRNFRKKLAKLDFIKPAGAKTLKGKHRPAKLYRFAPKKGVHHGSFF